MGPGETETRARPDTAGAARTIALRVDGTEHRLTVDPRRTLLDLLREQLGEYSAKKGCDHGQCGACTVLLDGRRVLSCLTLVLSCDGTEVTTAAGLAEDGELHSLQRSFVEHDAFQCGYCTPGQVCSAAGLLAEFGDGAPSHVTKPVSDSPKWTDGEISERMSGNLCRCGAYAGIVAAVREAGEQR
ncbi:xanthine dehydrogenase YagT iron-sulfur-binding subunit [Amycolatopsis echigonensis]|uniref:Xanthine dehydrogenase YagT iron-sulfur-binding subunit n=1 Tax=Amycolatopsis echigonensis TaxID=2576905 RepID=A0A2N3X212_9PSEU|nr:2Fe-2S iron-sulfur cluster-binding protein [Amycolatopsis niigatensis]PKW00150.1 xanthine dehydrogenase YagT iron-sulfur-binding subunit [Amycolatopsis niigatensis]